MKLAIVLESPRDASGPGHKYIDLTMPSLAKVAGVQVTHQYFFSVATESPKAPGIKQVREEAQRLMAELAEWAPDAIVTLGKMPLNSFSKEPVVLKNEHGRMRWVDLCNEELCTSKVPMTPTVAAWQVVRSPDLHRDWTTVVYKAVTQLAPLPPMDIETFVCESVDDLREALEHLEGASVVGVDVETGGLKPYSDDLLAVGIGAMYDETSGVAVVIPHELLVEPEVTDLIWEAVWRSSRRSVGHNFKFDMQFLVRAIGWPPEGASIGDTLLLAHLLDERPTRPSSRARGSGLKDLVAQRYDYQYGFDFTAFYAAGDAADWDAMHQYLGEDVVYTARLWHDLVKDSVEEGSSVLATHDNLLAPAAEAIAHAEYAGAPVDGLWVAETLRQIERRIIRRTETLERTLKPMVLTLVIDNIMSPQQIADVMYDEWGMTPDVRKNGRVVENDRSTDKDHMEAAIAKYLKIPAMVPKARWLQALQKLRKDVKLASTYQASLLDRRDDDGRVRASFLLHGASTGRLSAREPALQTIPAVDDREELNGRWRYKLRDGNWVTRPMRRAFAPKDGRLWIEVDYSQLELRVAAALSGDEAFIEVFRSGRDVHREVSAAIFSKTPEAITKPERYLAKAVAFGIIYGRSAEALATGAEMDYAERELGMTRWTTAAAELFIRKFLRSYPALEAWMGRLHKQAPVDGYVESAYGRRRRFPLVSKRSLSSIERQAVNTPIQSAASDICLEAFTAISRQILAEELSAVVLFPVHDSICIEAPPNEIVRVEAICRGIMEKEWYGVPLTVDFEYGPSWADVTAHEDKGRVQPRQGERNSGGSPQAKNAR